MNEPSLDISFLGFVHQSANLRDILCQSFAAGQRLCQLIFSHCCIDWLVGEVNGGDRRYLCSPVHLKSPFPIRVKVHRFFGIPVLMTSSFSMSCDCENSSRDDWRSKLWCVNVCSSSLFTNLGKTPPICFQFLQCLLLWDTVFKHQFSGNGRGFGEIFTRH